MASLVSYPKLLVIHYILPYIKPVLLLESSAGSQKSYQGDRIVLVVEVPVLCHTLESV